MANQNNFPESLSKHDQPISVGTIVEDFGRSFLQSSVISPLWNGAGKFASFGSLPSVSIVDTERAKVSAADCWAQRVGEALGEAADFAVLSRFRSSKQIIRGVDALGVRSADALATRSASILPAEDAGGFSTRDAAVPLAPGAQLPSARAAGAASSDADALPTRDDGVLSMGGSNAISSHDDTVFFIHQGKRSPDSHASARERRPVDAADYLFKSGVRPGFDTPLSPELDEYIRKYQAFIGHSELPVSKTSDPSSWRFIPETATELDANRLGLTALKQGSNTTELGDKVVQIKRFINEEAQPARDYLAHVAKNSDITIIGEIHTLHEPNPHRLLGAKVLSELPPGSTLAVELPSSLKPIFEDFNDRPGGSFQIPDAAGNMRPAITLLRKISSTAYDLVDMWKAARDRGIRVVPIDAELTKPGKLQADFALKDEPREAKMANELLSLFNNADGKPVVAWIGNLHAARSTVAGMPFLAKRIAESPQFASGEKKLSTVLGQLSEVGLSDSSLSFIAANVREAVGMPTSIHGQEAVIGSVPLWSKITAEKIQAHIKISDYDHVLLYPPTPPAEISLHRLRISQGISAYNRQMEK